MRRGNRARGALCLALLVSVALAACATTTTPPVKRAPQCPSPAAHSPRQLAIAPQRAGRRGMDDVAWSPDGACVALLGRVPATTSNASVGQVNVYDAYAGNLLARLHPDDFVLPAIGAEIRGQSADVQFTRVLWSLDGTRLALPFGVFSAEEKLLFSGVLLTDLAGAHYEVLTQPVPPGAAIPKAAGVPLAEWDVSCGVAIPLPSGLPAALGYHWGAGGALVADTPLNARGAPASDAEHPGPVGNPDGGAAFSIWQPGMLTLQAWSGQPNAPVELPGAYVWSSTFAAWSPDGRYLVDTISMTGRMQPAGHAAPSQQALRDFELDGAPLLPVRDAGLLTILNAMPTRDLNDADVVSLAWRPDGRYVVERIYYFFTSDGLDHSIGLYDGSTGQRVAVLAPFLSADAADGPGFIARWSPEGTRLLLVNYDPAQNQVFVTIWGPGALPA